MAKTLFNISDKIVAGDTAGEALAYRNRISADSGTLETFAETEAEIRRLQSLGLYDSLSLGYVAGGYKTSKWYNIKGATSDLAVVRATDATRVNRPFALQALNNNITATSYGLDGTLKGNYIRSALTNLFRSSEPATDPGAGTRTNVTFESNDWGIGLDGKVIFENNTLNRFYYNTATLTAGTYTIACIVKCIGGVPTFGDQSTNVGRLVIRNQAISSGYTVLNIGNDLYFVQTSGAISTTAQNNGFAKGTGNNSQRVEVSAIVMVSGNVSLTLEDYIKTVGATATRNADNISKTGIASEIGQTEGVIYAEVDLTKLLGSVTRGIMWLSAGADQQNGLRFQFAGTSVNTILASYRSNNVNVFSIPIPISTIGKYRIAMEYTQTGVIVYANGAEVGVLSGSSTPFILPPDKVSIGSLPNQTGHLQDYVYSGYHWKETKGVAKLQQLTTL